MLKIDKELFQWERGRYVFVEPHNPPIAAVEFYNQNSKTSKAMNVVDGQARFPDSLLCESLPITAVACTLDDEGTKAIARKTFKVIAKPKPDFYPEGGETEPDFPNLPGFDVIYDGGEVV